MPKSRKRRKPGPGPGPGAAARRRPAAGPAAPTTRPGQTAVELLAAAQQNRARPEQPDHEAQRAHDELPATSSSMVGEATSTSTRAHEPAAPAPVVGRRPWLVHRRPARLSLARARWGEVFAHRSPQVLAATYWLDSEAVAGGAVTHIGFTATRHGADERSVVRALAPVTQTSGPVAVTGVIRDVAPGGWDVTAAPVRSGDSEGRWVQAPRVGAPSATASGDPVYGPLALMLSPGVVLGAWPAMVLLAFLLALAVQGGIAAALGLPVGQVWAISSAASVLGLAGAKGYFLMTRRGRPRTEVASQGLSVQGFVVVAIVVVAVGTFLTDLPLGTVLDVSAPGLLAGQAVGRLGCVLSGCCVGRPTASRWGVWSSDRHLGCRRMPVQLLESAAAATIAAAAAAVVLVDRGGTGAVMVGAVAANVLIRQVLFSWRQEPRTVRRGRLVSTVVSLAALVIAVVVAVV